MKAAVIGFGSIGQRHTRILTDLVETVAVVSKRNIDYPKKYFSIETMLDDYDPSYIVISTSTNEHFDCLTKLERSGYTGKVLVEKPLFDMPKVNKSYDFEVYTGYNLRFHPVLQFLKGLLQNEEILTVNIYVGQYLLDWRPGTDYKHSYSAIKEKGGGVLRDLSHEIDYAFWLLGKWKAIAALGGKNSNLQINSDDNFSLLMEFDNCKNVMIHMNYLDKVSQRRIIINTKDNTYIADLIANQLQVNETVKRFSVNRDDTYILQHQAILEDQKDNVCSFEEGLEVVNVIKLVEKSSEAREWIYRA